MQNKMMIIFRGNGGRSLLPEKLTDRGAKVTLVETYQRTIPQRKVPGTHSLSSDNLPDAVVITSPDALKNLVTLLGEALWKVVCSCPFIIVGQRTYTLAANLGIRQRILALGAEDDHILQALSKLRDKGLEDIERC